MWADGIKRFEITRRSFLVRRSITELLSSWKRLRLPVLGRARRSNHSKDSVGTVERGLGDEHHSGIQISRSERGLWYT